MDQLFIAQREQPGLSGFARQDVPGEAYWLENFDIDRNGIYRPRAGLKWVKGFSAAVTHLSRLCGYTNRLMVIADGGNLYDLAIETGTTTTLDTGWPQYPIASCISEQGAGGNAWVACKAAISGMGSSGVGDVKKYDGTTLSSIPPGDGNYVGKQNKCTFRLASGTTTNQAVLWSDASDVDTWTATNAAQPLSQLVTVDAIVPVSHREALMFGPQGIARVYGDTHASPPPSITLVAQLAVATPMHHVTFCGDRVMFCAAGPRVMQIKPGSTPESIAAPLYRDLFLAAGVSNLRCWYDNYRREYCLADLTSNVVYRYSLERERWLGVHSYTDNTKDIFGGCFIDQGASAVDESTMPWVKEFVAVSERLLQWDPSVATDATASNASAAFTCAIEARSTEPDVGVEKQLTELQVDGYGTFTVKLRHRSSPDAAWTTVTLGTLTAPGILAPSTMPVYRERVIRIEASSSSTLRLRSMRAWERNVAEPLS